MTTTKTTYETAKAEYARAVIEASRVRSVVVETCMEKYGHADPLVRLAAREAVEAANTAEMVAVTAARAAFKAATGQKPPRLA
jgi:hypothetical protein